MLGAKVPQTLRNRERGSYVVWMSMRATRAIVVLGFCASLGCSNKPRDASFVAPPPRPSSADWNYQLAYDGTNHVLDVFAEFGASSSSELGVARRAREFVRDVEVLRGKSWQEVPRVDGTWRIDECASGCSVRYQFDLGAAAENVDDEDTAAFRSTAIVAPPSTWLLRPFEPDSNKTYRFELDARSEAEFVSGVWPEGRAYRAETRWLDGAPYSAFGKFRVRRVEVGHSVLRIAIAESDAKVDESAIVGWISDGARAVAAYYGEFPVSDALMLVLPTRGDGLHGQQLGTGGASVLLTVGDGVSRERLEHDWMATHEMTHLAVPELARRHLWLSEGIATYVEPLGRVRTGKISEQRIWKDLLDGIPKGLPEAGDRGLDNTHTWGRTYWGGALFCLRADVELQKRTQGRQTLRSALQNAARAGANGAVRWPVEKFLAAADRGTGHSVLLNLYREMSTSPAPIDLAALWKDLGVSMVGGKVRFDDKAPLAEIGRNIGRGA